MWAEVIIPLPDLVINSHVIISILSASSLTNFWCHMMKMTPIPRWLEPLTLKPVIGEETLRNSVELTSMTCFRKPLIMSAPWPYISYIHFLKLSNIYILTNTNVIYTKDFQILQYFIIFFSDSEFDWYISGCSSSLLSDLWIIFCVGYFCFDLTIA